MAKLEQKITFGIYKNIDIIGKLISKEIVAKELEYSIAIGNQNRKVDILCFDAGNRRDVFVEVQLGESDHKHPKFPKRLTMS